MYPTNQKSRALRFILGVVCWLGATGASAHAATVAPRHPFVLTTPAGLELARKRVRGEDWAKQLLARIVADARQLEAEPLPAFDREWWQVARTKRMQDIYPDVHRYAGAGVGGPMRYLTEAAIAYALTGEQRYLESACKVLRHYATYVFEARHPDVGMTWGSWGMAGLRTYDLIYAAVNADDRKIFDDLFARLFAAVMQNDRDWLREKWGGALNNHYAHHHRLIGTYGLFYGKPEYVTYAMESEQGLRVLIENAGLDDGLWHESSLNYHFTGVGPIAEFATILANAGHALDLWNQAFARGRRLRDYILAPIATLFPDETFPTIGDTYGRRGGYRSSQTAFEAYDALGDPQLGWVLRNARPPASALFLQRLPPNGGTPPEMKSRVWPEHGYVALRSQEGAEYWKGEGYSAFLSFDRNGIHSHRDKLGLQIYGRQAHLAVDPEAVASAPHAFSSRVQSELNRETVCHNTLMVDGKNHAWLNEKLDLSEVAEIADGRMATVSDLQQRVYRGVGLMRTVVVTPQFVLDVFQAESGTSHTYDYLFHSYDDRGGFAIAGDFQPGRLAAGPPWNWLKNPREATLDSAWSATARQGSLVARLTVAGEAGTRVLTCDFPRNDTFEGTPIPMLMVRRTAKSAVFVAVLQAERERLPETKISLQPGRAGRWGVTVDCAGRTREFDIADLRAVMSRRRGTDR